MCAGVVQKRRAKAVLSKPALALSVLHRPGQEKLQDALRTVRCKVARPHAPDLAQIDLRRIVAKLRSPFGGEDGVGDGVEPVARPVQGLAHRVDLAAHAEAFHQPP